MITREEFDKAESEYENSRNKYSKNCDELRKLSENLKGNVTDELIDLNEENKELSEKLCKAKQRRDKAGQAFVDDNLPYIDEYLREMFNKKHSENMRNGNWKPVIDELDELIKIQNS